MFKIAFMTLEFCKHFYGQELFVSSSVIHCLPGCWWTLISSVSIFVVIILKPKQFTIPRWRCDHHASVSTLLQHLKTISPKIHSLPLSPLQLVPVGCVGVVMLKQACLWRLVWFYLQRKGKKLKIQLKGKKKTWCL